MGCPNQCVFCNQRSISGCREFRTEEIETIIEEALATIPLDTEVEIAFFGGSFTGIDRALMIDLLERAERYVRIGKVHAIRLSTRPDYISADILEILSRYSVKTIELGLQSMSNAVLMASRRGHTAEQAEAACRMVKAAGFRLVGQMMIGLPESTMKDELFCAEKIFEMGADAARIYPTVVFYDTPLCEMVKSGSYLPLTLADAVKRSAEVLKIFWNHNIPCIRVGLCAGEDFSSADKVMAGPNHAALGELVWNEIYYEKLVASLSQKSLLGRNVLLQFPAREVSKYVGQHQCNVDRLLRETNTRIQKIVGQKNLEAPVPMLWQGCSSMGEEELSPCI